MPDAVRREGVTGVHISAHEYQGVCMQSSVLTRARRCARARRRAGSSRARGRRGLARVPAIPACQCVSVYVYMCVSVHVCVHTCAYMHVHMSKQKALYPQACETPRSAGPASALVNKYVASCMHVNRYARACFDDTTDPCPLPYHATQQAHVHTPSSVSNYHSQSSPTRCGHCLYTACTEMASCARNCVCILQAGTLRLNHARTQATPTLCISECLKLRLRCASQSVSSYAYAVHLRVSWTVHLEPISHLPAVSMSLISSIVSFVPK
jgi:hypothetical protein